MWSVMLQREDCLFGRVEQQQRGEEGEAEPGKTWFLRLHPSLSLGGFSAERLGPLILHTQPQ